MASSTSSSAARPVVAESSRSCDSVSGLRFTTINLSLKLPFAAVKANRQLSNRAFKNRIPCPLAQARQTSSASLLALPATIFLCLSASHGLPPTPLRSVCWRSPKRLRPPQPPCFSPATPPPPNTTSPASALTSPPPPPPHP